MNGTHLEALIRRPSQVADLGLPPVVDAPANAWLHRIRGAVHNRAARQARARPATTPGISSPASSSAATSPWSRPIACTLPSTGTGTTVC